MRPPGFILYNGTFALSLPSSKPRLRSETVKVTLGCPHEHGRVVWVLGSSGSVTRAEAS